MQDLKGSATERTGPRRVEDDLDVEEYSVAGSFVQPESSSPTKFYGAEAQAPQTQNANQKEQFAG